MTITIAVRSFARVERADIGVSGIALLAGLNEQGKTSTCLAVAAALTGQTVPVDGIKKASAGALVRTGDAEASVRVRSPEGEATVTWPGAALETTGKPPTASVFAAGLSSLVDLDEKARAKALAPYMPDALPNREALTAELKDAGVPLQLIDRVWAKIAESDWDTAWATAKESGKKLKGAWEQIAGQNFGTDKMKTWLPANWSEDLAGASLDALDMAVVHAKRALEDAISGAAVDADKLARLKTEAALLPDLQKQSKSEHETVEATQAKLTELEQARAALPPAEADAGMPCPHCQKGVRMRQVKAGVWQIEKAEEKLPPAEKKKRGDAIAVADGQIGNYRDKLTAAKNRLRQIEQDQGAAQRAANELAAIEAKASTAGGDSAGSVDKAREDLRTAEQRRAAFDAKTQADARAASITQNIAIQAALAPDGLRKKALGKALDAFNERLAKLCAAAGWKAVTIDADLSIKYGGRPYMKVWESQAYRVRATLAVAMAEIDKSSMLILDAAGVLDQKGRNGLIKMLQAAGIPALVAMTFSTPRTVPNLRALGMGEAYWIDQGIARPLDDVMVKEAA